MDWYTSSSMVKIARGGNIGALSPTVRICVVFLKRDHPRFVALNKKVDCLQIILNMWPTGCVKFIEQVPKLASGKIIRKATKK